MGGMCFTNLVIVTKSVSWEIFWQKWGRGKCAARFSGIVMPNLPSQEICWQK